MYNNFKPDTDESCISRGICSISPEITALQEVMFVMLRGLAFYVIKLELLGAKNEQIKQDMIKNIMYLSTLREYTEEQVHFIVNTLFSNFINTEKIYRNLCVQNGSTFDKFNSPIKFENNMDMNRLISEGDKVYKNKFKSLEPSIKNSAEILFCILKSLTFPLIELIEYKIDNTKAIRAIIKAVNLYNQNNITEEKIRANIYDLADLNAELMGELEQIKIKNFGKIRSIEVSCSTEKGKAILVSGNSMAELEEVLKYTQDADVNVYTNGSLLIAHSYTDFSRYSNLKGHFGNGVETSVLDFATFPGAILLTKNEAHNVDYLYRGRIFTTESIPPKGVAKISSGKLELLTKAAFEAKGFTKGQKRNSVKIGFDLDEVEQNFQEIADKLVDNTFRRLYIIDFSNTGSATGEYFKNFFAQKEENEAVISFSYNAKCDNIYTINIANDYTLAIMLMNKLFDKIPADSDKLTFFLTRCDSSAFAAMVRLNHKGAKSIYMSSCQPNIMNPVTLAAFRDLYNIKEMTTAGNDLENIRKTETE